MKKNHLILAVTCCLLGLLFSCQDSFEKPEFDTLGNVDPNLVVARKNLDAFVKALKPQTKNAGSELNIVSVNKKRLPIKLKDSLDIPLTRSALAELKDSADLYTFIFTKDENNGYAIVSGEEKVPRLYAYVEKGRFSDTIDNGGLRQALRMIEELYQDDVVAAYIDGANGQNSDISTFGYGDPSESLTKLQWNQWYPYNDKVPVACSDNISGRAPAGCVPVALSMAIAALEPYFAVQEDQVNLINKKPYPEENNEEDLVASLVLKVGSLCSVEYGCRSSGATAENASKALSHYWVIHQLENGLNANWTKNCLNKGYPIIAFGSDGSAGHCWLIDGGKKDSNGNYTFFYNNWGAGGWSNGFFAIGDCRYTNKFGEVFNYNKNNRYIYIHDVAK